jgi:hypothetical protein
MQLKAISVTQTSGNKLLPADTAWEANARFHNKQRRLS